MDGEAAASGLSRGCEVPGCALTAALFPVRGQSLLRYNFLCFFYTASQTNSFFVSKLSLSFPGYRLIQLMAAILCSMISLGLMVVPLFSKISFGQMPSQTLGVSIHTWCLNSLIYPNICCFPHHFTHQG